MPREVSIQVSLSALMCEDDDATRKLPDLLPIMVRGLTMDSHGFEPLGGDSDLLVVT